MIPVHKREERDCLRASLASLFEIQYEDAPDFKRHCFWLLELEQFFTCNGYSYQMLSANDEYRLAIGEGVVGFEKVKSFSGVNGLFLACVHSVKREGATHAVIIDKNFNIVHDPNIDYKGEPKPLAKELGYNGVIHVVLTQKAISI